MMFSNYLKTALRNIFKYKGYTLINTAGLTIGMAVCLLIFLWVKDELSYDRFHEKSDRIYRALWEAKFGDNEWKIPLVPVPLAGALEREFPEVERTTQLYAGGCTLKKGTEYVREQSVLFVDSAFFDVFTAEFVTGRPSEIFQNPDAVVLTEAAAARYFPGKNPVGKTLEHNDGKIMQVAGVVKGFPAQSHITFDFLASIENLGHLERRRTQWGSASVYTYFVANPQTQIDQLQDKLQAYVDRVVIGAEGQAAGNYTKFPFQALTDIHLQSNLSYELQSNGNLSYVYIFSIIGLFVLLLASVNYVNLATARSVGRAREVGIRKVLGSNRKQIALQFYAETLVMVVLALVLAVLSARFVMPYFNDLAGKELSLGFGESLFIWLLLAGIVVLTTALTGAYPAFFLAGYRPAKVLKGEIISSGGKNYLRQALVLSQFCISTALIIGTLVVRKQLDFLQNKQLGFEKEQVLVLHRAGALGKQHNTFIESLLRLPFVKAASGAQALPGKNFDSTVFLPEQPANYQETSLNYSVVQVDYAEVLGLEVVHGRNFSRELALDSNACLINQTAAKRLGWDDPLGKALSMGNVLPLRVIGVVEDFHFESLHHEVEPLVLFRTDWTMPYLAVKLGTRAMQDNIEAVKDLWDEFVPSTPFEYSFLKEDYQALYEAERRMARVFTVFSILAVFIACIGLFGLSSFLVTQRTKEIAIRKVLGASVSGIVRLFSIDFLKLVLVAIIIAVPLSWLAMHKWLQDFAYRT